MAKKRNKKFQKNIKKNFDKFWYLLWKDDSFKGWLFSVIFLIIFIMFIFFPLLRLATGTSLPLAIVESCSMHHKANVFSDFDSWWEKHDEKYSEFIINKLDFQDFPFKNGFSKGDILFITGAEPENIQEGDVIIFQASGYPNPLIHRVVDIQKQNDEYLFSTIGDNNDQQLSVEKQISEDKLVGKAVFRIVPYAGWAKLVFFEHLRPEQDRGFCEEN